MNRKAFTLIELLVVIAIIAILAAILFPVFARARAKAQQAACTSNLKQIALAIRMYAADYDDFMPVRTDGYWWRTDRQLGPYTKSPQVFVCPSQETLNGAGGTPSGSWHGLCANMWGVNSGHSANWAQPKRLSKVVRVTEVITFCDGIGSGSGNAEMNDLNAWCCYSGPDPALWGPPFSAISMTGLTAEPPYWPFQTGRAFPKPTAFVGRHNGMMNCSFIDGHAKAMRLDEIFNGPNSVMTFTAWPQTIARYLMIGPGGG